MYIGEVAQLTGASPKAIRLYEQLGLLGKVTRQGVYRVYGEQQLMRVKLIRQAQTLGFKLAELEDTLIQNESELDWYFFLQEIAKKRKQLAAEIARMTALDMELTAIEIEIKECLDKQATMQVNKQVNKQAQ